MLGLLIEYERQLNAQAEHIKALEAERDVDKLALSRIDDIRNSIVGLQMMNWSEHIYPLVAALEEAGIAGRSYPENVANYGTALERAAAAEAELERLRLLADCLRGYALAWHLEHCYGRIGVDFERCEAAICNEARDLLDALTAPAAQEPDEEENEWRGG